MKKCPFCAEEIQDDAVKCKHCGEFLIDAELKHLKKGADVKWYHRTSFVIIMILCLGPFAFPLLWFNPKYSIVSKVTWTIVIIALTVGLGVAMIQLYAHLLGQIEKMGF